MALPSGRDQQNMIPMSRKGEAGIPSPAALGFRAHSGWAVLITVAGSATATEALVVIDRRRIELVEPGSPETVQPYHTAARLGPKQAEAFIKNCAERARLLAIQALRAVIDHLSATGHQVVASGILLSSGRPTTDLAATLASHALIHTAEGHLFREALTRASEHHHLPVMGLRERELFRRASAELGTSPDEVRRRVAALGHQLGPPWRQDEKHAALVAWLALASRFQR
ncbi:MAG TPA: hypothetical protein VI455_13265 [Terriglobia bacterium]